MLMIPKCVDIGKPEKNPGVILEPISDPVPRENPVKAPVEPVRKPSREPVPA